jgi:hypothetical protein
MPLKFCGRNGLSGVTDARLRGVTDARCMAVHVCATDADMQECGQQETALSVSCHGCRRVQLAGARSGADFSMQLSLLCVCSVTCAGSYLGSALHCDPALLCAAGLF